MSRRKQFNHELPCNCFIFSLFGQLGSAAIQANQNDMDRDSIEMINEKNLAFQREQFDYQKELNALQMEREDTAFQRQVEDAQKVGINPMALAGGSGAPTQSLNSTSLSGSSIAQHSNPISIDTSSLNNIPQLLMNVDQWKNQRDALRSQMANDEVDRAIKLYESGLQYDDNGKIIPIPSDSPKYRKVSAEAKQQETRNEYYGNYPDNLPNYPAIMTFVNKGLSNPDDYPQVIEGIKNVFPFAKRLSEITHGDFGKIGESLWNIYLNSKNGRNTINKVSKSLANQEASKISKKAYKHIKKNQANYYNNLIRNNYENANK